jgi:CheY-like chemotaxis protein
VDLVISDLVMPQMSGRELIEHLHRLSPATPVICSSGYIRPAHLEEDEAYLQKPFTSQDLLRKVKQALSPSGSD